MSVKKQIRKSDRVNQPVEGIPMVRLVHTIRFLLRFKELTDAKQYVYELKQCQLKNRSENRIVLTSL